MHLNKQDVLDYIEDKEKELHKNLSAVKLGIKDTQTIRGQLLELRLLRRAVETNFANRRGRNA